MKCGSSLWCSELVRRDAQCTTSWENHLKYQLVKPTCNTGAGWHRQLSVTRVSVLTMREAAQKADSAVNALADRQAEKITEKRHNIGPLFNAQKARSESPSVLEIC